MIDARITESGPVRTSLQIQRRFMDSTICQTIILYHDIPRIDFKTVLTGKRNRFC